MKHDPRTDPEVPPGMSIALLQDLHLLTRDGHLNADARRKLKQIRHLLHLLRPALDDALARAADPLIVDCGAGKPKCATSTASVPSLHGVDADVTAPASSRSSTAIRCGSPHASGSHATTSRAGDGRASGGASMHAEIGRAHV